MESPDLYFPELSPIENDMLCKNYSIGDSKEILIITIDIGDGRKDEIQAYEYDDSDQLALDFCYKHMLGARAKILLADEIEKYLKIAIQRANSKKIQENPAQGLNRARRSQSFTQKSMQVKRSLTRKRTPVLQPKHSVSVFSNKFLSVQETSDSPRLKHQRSLSKSVKSDSVNLLYQATEVKGKGVNKRSPVRCNSLYTKIEESSPEKSSDK